jgi:hypothetical protein
VRRLRAATALAAFTVAACGGGGGGGGTPTDPTPPAPSPGIVFSPQTTTPGGSSVALAASPLTTANTLFLEVRVNGVTDLYGVAYDLTFPSGALQFVRATPGPLLAAGTVQAASSTPGRLVVGGTLLGPVAGISGSGVLMTVELSAVATGGGDLAFSRQRAVSSQGVPISGLEWVAGSVRVTR